MNHPIFTSKTALFLTALLAGSATVCAQQKLSGTIRGDGSSTVFPITEAVAEEFQKIQPRVRVTVGISGTGGGFKKFCAGETDIQDASRPISKGEMALAVQNGVEYIELPVALDGLAVMVNPANDFVRHLTVAELKKIWEPGSAVKTWSDVRPAWPKRKVNLYGPGHDSGTFDYFTEVVVGKARASRADAMTSEDDNVLVQGIAGDKDALGYFGYAYYEQNRSRLKVVPIDGGGGPVPPSKETVESGAYAPLSRPLFLYIKKTAADRAEVAEFVRFYLAQAPVLAPQVGYVALPKAVYAAALARFNRKALGTVYKGEGHKPGMSMENLFAPPL